MSFFSLNFVIEISNLFVLLLGDSINDLFFVFFKNIFNMREVCFDNSSHSAEALKQCGNLILQGYSEATLDFRFHHSYHTFDFFLVICVLRYQVALELHNSFND